MSAETSTEVVLFVADGICPVLQWLDRLPGRVQRKCAAKVWWLQQRHAPKEFPTAVRDGAVCHFEILWEGTRYFLFYSVSGFRAVILHGCSCSSVPERAEFKIAEARRVEFEQDPETHIYTE